MTSKRRKSSSCTCLARCGFAIPCFFKTFKPRLSDRSPLWRSSIPALSISQSALFPLFSRRCLRIASAEGERHIFLRQTNRIFQSLLSAILNGKSITSITFCKAYMMLYQPLTRIKFKNSRWRVRV